MVTRSHTQLKEDEITEDLSVCDISEPTLKNFVVNEDQSHEEPWLKLNANPPYNKVVKQSESLLNYFLGTLWKKQCVLSITNTP